MKTKLYILFTLLVLSIVFIHTDLAAQGCVAVRSMGGNTVCNSNNYTLPKGEFQIGTGYRYFHSWRHFVGSEEQPHRQTTNGGHDANGKERGNAVNIYSHSIDLNFSYAITNRLQLNATVPYVHNERSQVWRPKYAGEETSVDRFRDTVRYSVYAKGLGDIRVSANYWMFDPSKQSNGNLSIGLGVKLNTGSWTEKGKTPFNNETTKDSDSETTFMDQAIQPGDGGVGFSVEVQGFRKIYKGIYGFVSGYYLFNPKESNGTFKSAPTVVKDEEGNVLGTLNGYNVYACPDQFLVRYGFSGSIGKEKNLTLSAGGRVEGIPAYDAFGGQEAYRRPGYVVAVEPSVSYKLGKHSFSLIVPYNYYKKRIQSAADEERTKLENSVITEESKKVRHNGDAAFADYSINFIYSYRLGKLF